MKAPVISKFFGQYRQKRETPLSEVQFGTLLMFFPALLVVACDGEIDEEEMVYLDYLARAMSENCEETTDKAALQDRYYEELSYLVRHLNTWERPFLDTLHEYLCFNPLVKEDILDILHLFAEASSSASEEEAAKIEDLRAALFL